jgi:hypothetical protein
LAARLCTGVVLIAAMTWSLAARATYNATVIGTVSTFTQFGTALQFDPETVICDLDNQPTIPCPQGSHFILSPNTITDAQTRRNMVAILLHAKATGRQVEVAYDNADGYCDQGYAAVYYRGRDAMKSPLIGYLPTPPLLLSLLALPCRPVDDSYALTFIFQPNDRLRGSGFPTSARRSGHHSPGLSSHCGDSDVNHQDRHLRRYLWCHRSLHLLFSRLTGLGRVLLHDRQ